MVLSSSVASVSLNVLFILLSPLDIF